MTVRTGSATNRSVRLTDDWGVDANRAQRLVYIPTHRPFEAVLEQVAAEVSAVSTGSDDEFQLLLIDDRPLEQTRSNRDAAARAARTAGFPLNWMGHQEWAAFVERLLAQAELGDGTAAARTALLKPSGSYAAGMNKASLFAAFLGARSLHRRDSDEFPGRRTSDGLTALAVEVAALDLAPVSWPLMGGRPFFVGTDVQGEPTKDHRDLLAAGPDLRDRLEAISSMRRGSLQPLTAPRRALLDIGGGVNLERDEGGRTEVGVSACRRVFEWIPEMPVVGVLGTDHFQKGLLYQLGLPVVWHPLSAVHVYEPARTEQRDVEGLRRYVLAEFRYVVLRQYWNRARDRVRSCRDEVLLDGEQFVARPYADAFREVLALGDVEAEVAVDAFIDIHREAVHRTTGEVRARHILRLEELEAVRSEVVPYVRTAVDEFASLVEAWPRLVAAARLLRRGVGR